MAATTSVLVPDAEGDAREAPPGAAPAAPAWLAAGRLLVPATAPLDGLAVTEMAAPPTLCAAADARSAAASPALAAALPAADAEGSALKEHNYEAPFVLLEQYHILILLNDKRHPLGR